MSYDLIYSHKNLFLLLTHFLCSHSFSFIIPFFLFSSSSRSRSKSRLEWSATNRTLTSSLTDSAAILSPHSPGVTPLVAANNSHLLTRTRKLSPAERLGAATFGSESRIQGTTLHNYLTRAQSPPRPVTSTTSQPYENMPLLTVVTNQYELRQQLRSRARNVSDTLRTRVSIKQPDDENALYSTTRLAKLRKGQMEGLPSLPQQATSRANNDRGSRLSISSRSSMGSVGSGVSGASGFSSRSKTSMAGSQLSKTSKVTGSASYSGTMSSGTAKSST